MVRTAHPTGWAGSWWTRCASPPYELGSRYGLHPNLITNWKRQAIENLAKTFSTKAERTRTNDDPQIKELHAKIGQRTVERDFLAKAFGR